MEQPARIAHPVSLDDLIDAIKGVHTEALDQLTDAVLAAEHLGEVADNLIGHFVDQARRSGASWTDIGKSMGVTKQPPRTPPTPPATPRSPRTTPCWACSAIPRRWPPPLLRAQNVTAEAARAAVTLAPRAVEVPALIPFSASARKALESTLGEALRLGHNYIGAKHMLLSLLEKEDADGASHQLGVDKSRAEADLNGMLAAITSQP